jgi:hypothetical protein
MPYKDPINEHVKRVVSSINRRFIAHTDLLGSTNAINSKNPSVEPQGQSLLGQGRTIGGSKGCASWSAGTATKHYEKSDEPSERSGGAILGLQDGTLAGDRSKPKYSQTSYKAPETDNTGKFGALGDAFASRLDAKPLGPVAANSRSGYAHKDDSPLEGQDLAYAQQHGLVGTGKLQGEGFFDDVWSGIKSVGSIAKPFVGLVPGYGPAAQMAMSMAGMGREGDHIKDGEPVLKKKVVGNAGHGIRGSGKECTCPRLKSGKAPKRCKCGARLQGEGFFDDVWSGIKSVGSIAKPFVGLVPGYGPAAQMAMSMAGMGAPECTCPRLKSGKAPKRCKCGYRTGKGMSGGSGFAAGTHMDVGSGETLGISSHKPTRGAGKPRKRGGAVLGLVKAPVAGPLDQTPPAYGNKVSGPKSTSKKDLDKPTTKADMPSSTLSGGKRNARAEIVKKIMKERGVKLMEASSIVKKEGLYKR